ncbi:MULTISPECIES: hypothetical protein [unclassified Providencia]|uniref:hypothetical protein n=1 Tax=unclassified Providencia TaxID=2633465 RepID=UPI00234A191B|nr:MULTISPECIES: hypothetical protein [unclassified Providencia]
MRKIKITKKNAGVCHVTVGHVYKLDDGADIGSTLRFLDDYGNQNLIQLNEASQYFDYELIYCEEPELMASDATLRDKFAMAALPIAWKAKEDGYYEGDDEDVAACAYQMAGAMLKARG